jgi:hypothetical protein
MPGEPRDTAVPLAPALFPSITEAEQAAAELLEGALPLCWAGGLKNSDGSVLPLLHVRAAGRSDIADVPRHGPRGGQRLPG